MSSHARVRFPSLLVALVGLCSCIEDLLPKDVVRGPRILDIFATRPEINPGMSTEVRVLLAGTMGVPTYRWYACIAPDATRPGMGLANFGEATFEGCFGDATPRTLLGRNPTATFRAPPNTLDNLEALAMRFGQRVPAEVLAALARDVGLVIGLAVEVDVDGTTLRAYKRIVISSNPHPNANPPPPRFQVNRVWVSTAGQETDTCAPEDGSRLRVPRNTRVGLAPESNEETWQESYRVLTASGLLVDRRETAFYSWYTTNGRMAQSLTRSPTRNNEWVTQSYPRDETLWVLLRDGHGGTSGCRVAVTVE